MQLPEYLLNRSFDLMREGVIIVDRTGVVVFSNRRAKALLGLGESVGPGHPEGRIREGDIVLIADSCLGLDDGGLTPKDLKLLGVRSDLVKVGDAFVLIGIYKGMPGNGSIAVRHEPPKDPLALYRLWPGKDGKTHKLWVKLSEPDRLASAGIDDQAFSFEYQVAVGHMVIVDPETLEVRFYQTLGYTPRREDVRSILMGSKYRAKHPGKESMDITGEAIWKICPEGLDTAAIAQALSGLRTRFGPHEAHVNGIPMRYSILPVGEGPKPEYAVIILDDILEVTALSSRADAASKYASFLRMRLGKSASSNPAFAGIVGRSKAIRECVALAEKAAYLRSNVLLLGESGTGKSVLARAIHDASPRRGKPFVVVNCAAVPPNLMESELFGYAGGAFTGALKTGKKGKFQEAHEGTLLLDEVADLDLACQAKLLHAIEEGVIQPLGSSRNIKVDVRIIAATNQDLKELVQEGKFRRDLYYRLNVFPIWVPPLRERPEDILELVEVFLWTFSAMYRKDFNITQKCLTALLSHDWPGNVRELENVLERACALAEDGFIDLGHLPPDICPDEHSPPVSIPKRLPVTLDEARKEAERNAILQAIEFSHGNFSEAVRILGISRTTFYQKLKELGISTGFPFTVSR